MKKNKKTFLVILMFTVLLMQVFLPSKTNAADINLNWSNPSQGSNPFKFSINDFLNPQIAMSVVGCTNVVNKVSGATTDFVKSMVTKILLKRVKQTALDKICQSAKTGIASGLSSIPNLIVGNVILKQACLDTHPQKTVDSGATEAQNTANKLAAKQQTFEQCLNGIAITLAKNELVSMTKSTMNWITTGFNGDPMYIQNIDNFMSNLSNQITNKELDMFKTPSGSYDTVNYPYAMDVSKAIVAANDTANNKADSLKQDLTSYIAPGSTPRVAIQNFSNDFSKGGWSGWLALTQHPQNNPLGFETQSAQDLANKKEQQKEDTTNELNQNNGYLSQKVCDWSALTKKQGENSLSANQSAVTRAQEVVSSAKAKLASAQKELKADQDKLSKLKNERSSDINILEAEQNVKFDQSAVNSAQAVVNSAQASYNSTLSQIQNSSGNINKQNPADCPKWKIVTPGSTIKDKVATYINSPERQLELAKTINDSLYALFGALINKFRTNGLISLGSNNTTVDFGVNSLTNGGTVDSNGNPVPNSGGYSTDSNFDLTKDLGNQYYHVPMKSLGNWNAATNDPILSEGIGPYDPITKQYLSDVYYTVTKAGNTKLVKDGLNNWGVGDRAYFDGTNWQNWKQGTPNPIKKRGILQVQQDFIAASFQLLKNLPGIMPKIGELDYCIPGPNPSWLDNSSKTIGAFSDFINAFNVHYTQGGFLVRKYVTIDAPSGQVFDAFRKIFNGTDLWSKVTQTDPYRKIQDLASSGAAPNKGGKWKGNKHIAAANDAVTNLKNSILSTYNTFTTNYTSLMDVLYGSQSLMQKQYLQNEATPVLKPNPAYLPMAGAGLSITSQINTYNNQITQEASAYRTSVAQAEANLYQLKDIAKQVRQIVKDAQDRRTEKMAKLKQTNSNIKVEAGEAIKKGDKLYQSGSDTSGNPIVMKYTPDLASLGIESIGTANVSISSGSLGRMTKGSITDWTIPTSCLAEEQADYIDNGALVTDMGGTKEERCSDGIDNDLNGLVDAQDPACQGAYTNNGPDNMDYLGGKCSIDMSTYTTSEEGVGIAGENINSGDIGNILPYTNLKVALYSVVAGENIVKGDPVCQTDTYSNGIPIVVKCTSITSTSTNKGVFPCNVRPTKTLCLATTSTYQGKEVECSWEDGPAGGGSTGGGAGTGSGGLDYLQFGLHGQLPSQQ